MLIINSRVEGCFPAGRARVKVYAVLEDAGVSKMGLRGDLQRYGVLDEQ